MNHQTRFCSILSAAFVLLTILSSGMASAQSINAWSFSLLPASGSISGSAGSTIGWGYEVSNLSTTAWLFATDIQASGPFLHGTVDSVPFDYPILAPLSSVSVVFDGTSGLAKLAWDKDAPVGFTNSGIFKMSADFYDGDPFNLLGCNSPVLAPLPDLSCSDLPCS